MTTFTWRIDDELPLVHGFIRDASKCMSNVIIPNSIHHIIASFYESLLKQIKLAAIGEQFYSPVFQAQGFKWYLAIRPNGLNQKREGSFECYVHLAYLPPKVKSIKIERVVKLQELNLCYEIATTFKEETGYGWPKGTLKLSDVQRHHELTLSVKLSLYGVLDKDDNQFPPFFDVKELNQTRSMSKVIQETVYLRVSHLKPGCCNS